jgi:predicted PurR-regulated permease PerM
VSQRQSGFAAGTSGGSKAALLLVAAGVGVVLVGALPLAGGLLAAPALAVVCQPLQRRLAARVGPHGAALLVLILVWLALVVPAAWLATLAIRQMPDALRALQQRAGQLHVLPISPTAASVDSVVARIGSAKLGWVSEVLGPALGNIASGILNLSIALLGLYFLLVMGDAAWGAVSRRLPFSPAGSDELRNVFISVTRGTLLGTLLSAALQGLSIGVGFRLIGNSAPAFWGLVGGFATLVPVFGNALIWVPAVIATLVQGRFQAALVMLLLGKLVPSLLDRIVRTGISRRVGHTHPMVTLLGTLVGLRLLGAVGVLIGPTLVQVSLELIRLYEREYGLPWSTSRAD